MLSFPNTLLRISLGKHFYWDYYRGGTSLCTDSDPGNLLGFVSKCMHNIYVRAFVQWQFSFDVMTFILQKWQTLFHYFNPQIWFKIQGDSKILAPFLKVFFQHFDFWSRN